MAQLRDLHPRYLVSAGPTRRWSSATARPIATASPSALGTRGCTPRRARAATSGAELAGLVRPADVVLLPYDSREQVTSGVLIEAVAAGRPVVSTAFPHAIELLADGTGLLVPQRDPVALAAALRRVLSEPGLADDHGRAGRAEGARAALVGGGRPLPHDCRGSRRGRHGGGLMIELVHEPQVARVEIPAPPTPTCGA